MNDGGSQSSIKSLTTRASKDRGLDLNDDYLNEESFKHLSLMSREKQASQLDHAIMMSPFSSLLKVHPRQTADRNKNSSQQKLLSTERKTPELLAIDLKNLRLHGPRLNTTRKTMMMATTKSETKDDENMGSPFDMGQTWGRKNVKTGLTGLEDEVELGKSDEIGEEKMPEWMAEEESLKLFDFSRSTQAIEKEHLKYKATWFREEPSVEMVDHPLCKYQDNDNRTGTSRTVIETNDEGTYRNEHFSVYSEWMTSM